MGWAKADSVRAFRANERGRKLADAGDDAGAEREYRRAIELDPSYEPAWFNLGLIHKRRHEWTECAECNLKASALRPGKEEPAWWNLGIAATALRDWELARRAWNGYGINVPEGEGPITMSLGYAPVRLNPKDSGEVVWGARIDPARVVIDNVPFPESGHRYGDVVLHDGVPNGERVVNGKTYGVFDELEIWEKSDNPTVVAHLICATESDATDALRRLDAIDVRAEDWTRTVRVLCKACSEGRPHRGHDHNGVEGWRTARDLGCVGGEASIAAALTAWSNEAPGRLVEAVARAL